MRRDRVLRYGGILGGLGLLSLALFYLDSDSSEDPANLAQRTLKPLYKVANPKPAPPVEPAAEPPIGSTPAIEGVEDEVLEQIVQQVSPDSRVIHCNAASDLKDGVYGLIPAARNHAFVRGGAVTIAVTGETGSAQLEQALHVFGHVRWAEDICAFSASERVTVRGVLKHADGEPAVDYEVRGCAHGSFARTNAEGEWEMEAVAGTTCHPMAFVEADDGAFGKSNVVDVSVTAPGPIEGISLVLPAPEDLWGEKQLQLMAAQLSGMIEPMLNEQEDRLAQSQEALQGCKTPQSCAVLQQVVEGERRRAESMRDVMERLDDEGEQNRALMDQFLGLY